MHPLTRNPDFLRLTAAGIISTLGGKISQLALPLLALGLTGSPAVAGLLGAAQQLPYLLLSLPAGAFVDRVNRRRLLVGCDLARFLAVGSIPLAYAMGALGIPQLFVVVFLTGSCTVLASVADLAALPAVVERGQLAQARAVQMGVDSAAEVAGPSLGGLIIGLGRSDVVGAALAYLVDSLSYLASGLTLLRVRRPLQPTGPRAPSRLADDIRAGLGFLWGHGPLRALMLLTTAVNLLQAPLYLLTVLVARGRLGLDAAALGLVFGAAGCAAVAGAALAPRLYARLSLRAIVVGAIVAWAGAALLLAVAQHVALLTLAWVLIHLLWPIYDVAVVSYRLDATPDALHGRVISAFRTLSYGAEPLGIALGGLLAAPLGAPALFAAIAGGLALCGAAGYLRVDVRSQKSEVGSQKSEGGGQA